MAAVDRVLIVGAGIAGQTLACALARRSIGCEIVEIKTGFEMLGAGMYVQSNALRAFSDIGIVEEIVRTGWPAEDDSWSITDARGNELARPLYPRIAGPGIPAQVPMRRKALHDVLARAVARAGVAVRTGVTVEAIEERGGTARVRFSDGTAGEYGLIVGADGIRSKVRALAFGPVEPVFTGFSNWRVVLPRPAEVVRPIWMMGRGVSFGITPIADDALYIAGVTKEPGNPRYKSAALPGLCRTRFAEFGGLAPQLLAQVREPAMVVYTPIEEVRLDPPWHKGRVVLVGDAAHAGAPFWAQGASMAIEDVILLARLLERGAAVEPVLQQWMAKRYDRCRFVQSGSLKTGVRSHSEDAAAAEARPDYGRLVQEDIDRRYARLAEPFD